jgi:hypothetical protein
MEAAALLAGRKAGLVDADRSRERMREEQEED